MYKQIEEKLGIKIACDVIDEIEINISKVKEKILFFYNINHLEDLESYTEQLAYLFQKYGYKRIVAKIIEGEKLKNRFVKKDEFTLPEFLWDLCIIFINNGNIQIPINIRAKVERDTFFARKIIIDQNESSILESLQTKLFPEKQISNLIEYFDFSEDSIVANLFISENGEVKSEEKMHYIEYVDKNESEENKNSLTTVERYLKKLESDMSQIRSDFQQCKGE